MSDPKDVPPQKIEYGTAKSYWLCFVLSVLLTLAAYFLAEKEILRGLALDISVALLALIQAGLQLVMFFNLMSEPKPRWNLMTFLFMAMVLLIIVFGSIWIMNSLNYRLM